MLVWPVEGAGKLENIKPRSTQLRRLDDISKMRGKSKKEKDYSLSRKLGEQIKESDLFRFLKKRRGKLEAVVITGGEPTIHKDLPSFIRKIKKLGYLVKLDTNGSNPKMLKELIDRKLIDHLAMDVKASQEKYSKITGVKINFDNIKKSVKIIIDSKLPHEFRTTLAPGLLTKDDINKIGKIIKGAQIWYLQKFKKDTELINDKIKKNKNFNEKEIEEMAEIGKKYAKKCEIR